MAYILELASARATAERNDEPAYLRSETLRLLKEQERAPTTLSNHPNPSGLPVCFICTRPILGVMARAAGKDLHEDCLSCATCGNSLRNVGHHFIDDKFYCDIHGSQKKAGGARPGMDPNIFVKSSPTATQPVYRQESPRAAYQPQVNSPRPVSVSPAPPGGRHSVTTHYHTPKTQGILSPSQRGIPTAVFGADHSKTVSYGGGTQYDTNRLSPAPSQFSNVSQKTQQQTAPPMPSNPPPSNQNQHQNHNHKSRVPESVRSAVSPRRATKAPRQWPPPENNNNSQRYWKINAAETLKKEKPATYGSDLVALIKECEADKEPPKTVRKKRLSNISKDQVQKAFEEHRKRRQEEPKSITSTQPSEVHKPIAIVGRPYFEEDEPLQSYIVKNPAISFSSSSQECTSIQTRVTRHEVVNQEERPNTLQLPSGPSVTDSSTSPIPSIRLHRKPIPSVSITNASGPPLIVETEKKEEAELPKKAMKRVDFSKASPVAIETEWKQHSDIVDESDILTEASRDEDSVSLANMQLKTYDGDESEMIDDVTSTFELDEEPKQEDKHEQWRQRAMQLLDDDSQTERDLMIVAALNERLQGLRDMEEDDRIRAIECIARHQNDLEQTQTQLSNLLESAIQYLRNLQTDESEEQEMKPPIPPERHVFPFFSKPAPSITQSLHDVLDEHRSIQQAPPAPPTRTVSSSDAVEDSRNFLASRLGQCLNLEGSYTKSSFERTTTETRPYDAGNGNGQNAGEFRGTGSLNQQSVGGRIPFCEACKQQIRGAFVLATGKSWCPEHFVCANSSCRRRLLECGFVEEDGQKFCETCFEQHIAPRCAKCSKPIVSDCLNALQKKWHPTCFTCAHCQKPFGNSAFYLEQGLPYCEQDWNALFTTKCVSCRYPIEAGDRWVEALGSAFHSNCFTCARCNHNLEGESFFAKNGQPFCKLHA
ncbi:unnamed protein product [Caenorhabditis bovis]|uniref:LIM zinc-binding domain-containing protein n=1 Tax=Caenorhabditis bovis TaxID=2654633 RepID=A0A8S1F1G3_9PELO|nr:unnamed protein product [Caenorhabditis bovis]